MKEKIKDKKYPPVITIIEPLNYQKVTGNVLIKGSASDNKELKKIELQIDNGDYFTPLKIIINSKNKWYWEHTWDTSGFTNREINIRAIAYDSAGNITPESIYVYVDNFDKSFIHRKGDKLVQGTDEDEIYLRGVAFGNSVWSDIEIPSSHHNDIDFQRVKDMGMNVIRFYLNYKTFEDDSNPYVYKQTGWDWLDQNAAWAKQYGIYLILNIHVPQGGFQSLGEGLALWDVPENQSRFKALWRAIAWRYRNEQIIAGYDLLNEPYVSGSVNQWKTLAQETVDEIREVDKNHLLIIEQLLGVTNDWSTFHNPSYTQFLVDDNNVMYDFHYYYPSDYSHQNIFGNAEGGAYPDTNKAVFPIDLIWAWATFDNQNLPSGDTDWTNLEGVKFHVTDPSFIAAKPALIAKATGSGTVYFDDFIIKEYDQNTNFVRTIIAANLEFTNKGWYFWSEDGSGEYGVSETESHQGSKSIFIKNTTKDANLSCWQMRFEVKQGYFYSISGWMKGVNIDVNAECKFRIDFDKSESGAVIHHRDKDYLEYELDLYSKFGKENNVPMYVGEFGLYHDCFRDDRGGLNWISDMLEFLNKKKIHFTYHSYHEQWFGIYTNWAEQLPDPAYENTPLVDLFKTYLK